jgi:hypothetical protein
MRVLALLYKISVAALVVLSACSKQPMMRPVMRPAPECMILRGTMESPDSITVALLDEVHPEHAPYATNASEQLLFNHLYETLITIDCLGRVRAGLAESWSRGEGGRCWTFELSEDAHFWDGTPVTAGDIVESWQQEFVDRMALAAGIDSTTYEGDQILHVYLSHVHWEVPLVLSELEFAVAKRHTDSLWPLGTGFYQIVPSEQVPWGMSSHTITVNSIYDKKRPVIKFLVSTRSDTRDLLMGTVDVMVTVNPDVIDYAESQPQLTAVALPWDRTYVLLSTSLARESLSNTAVGLLPSNLLDGLALDAVRGEARGHRPISWWEDLRMCGELSFNMSGLPPLPRAWYNKSELHRIVYDSNDPVAKDLTERIVALAATDPGISYDAAALGSAVPGLTGSVSMTIAEGVTKEELAQSLRSGDDYAYIVHIPLRSTDPCYEARRLLSQAHWLLIEENILSRAIVPLVDTRRHVIADRRRVELMIDWNGNILVANGMLQER